LHIKTNIILQRRREVMALDHGGSTAASTGDGNGAGGGDMVPAVVMLDLCMVVVVPFCVTE
jgi:hypothetical protein